MQNSWILKINKYSERASAELYFHSKSWTRSKKNHETEAFCILQPLKYAVCRTTAREPCYVVAPAKPHNHRLLLNRCMRGEKLLPTENQESTYLN